MRPDTMRVDSAHSDFIAAGNFMSTGFFARAHRVRGGFFALVGLLLFAFALPASAQSAPSFPVDKFEYIFINTSERGPIGIVGTNSEQIANTLTYTFSPALRVGYELSKSTSRGAYINATGSANHGWVTYTLTAENSAGSDTAQVIFKNVSQPSFGSQWSNYVFTFYQSPPTTFRMPEINVSAYDLQFSRYRFGGSQTSLSGCGLLDVPATGSEYIRDYILRSDSTTKLSGDPAVDSAKCDYGSHSFFGHYNVDGGFQSARLANLQFVVLASAPGPSLGQGNVGFTSGAASLKTLNAAGVPGGIGASITTYTIAPETGTMPDSLTFNPDTRQLGSTDAIVAGDAGSYVYTATDSRNLSVAVTFSVTVAAAVSLDPANPADLAFEAGTAAVITLPTPAGGVPRGGVEYDHTLYVDDTEYGNYSIRAIPGMVYRVRYQNITQIFGTPTTVGEHEIRFSATDTNGATANATFSVSITSLPVFTQQDDLSFTAGFVRTFNLDAATGGTGTLVYDLNRIVSGAIETIPDELVFTAADNLELRSTNALATTDGGSYEFKVTDGANNIVTTTFSIIVADQLVSGANPGNQLITMVAGTAITAIDIADATGGQDTNYALTGGGSTLADGDEIGIAGLTYNARTSGSPATPANISGEPTATGSVMLTYTATDANGATVSVAFSVEVIDLPTFPTAQGNVEFTAGFVKTVELNQASGGLSPLTYSLKRIAGGGALETIPDTLVFVADDRELSSTAGLVTMSAGSYEYRVTDARGNFATSIFMVNIALQLVAGANPGDQTILSTETAAITLADATGGKATVGYTLNTAGSALTNGANIGIAGLIYNSRSSGTAATITGMPTATGQVMLTYTATDANGASVSYDFAVNAFDMPTFLTAQPNLSFTVGHPVTTFLNQALGGNPANSVTYSLMRIVSGATEAIPNGLTFNTATRELGNTDDLATTDAGSYELKVTATNGMTAGTFSIAVAPALVAAANPGAQTFLVGDAKSVTLGNATGGQAGLVYALTVGGVPVADGGQVSAAGIAYTAATSTNPATISGAATASGATTQVVYTVTDANGATAAFTFALNVFPKPSFAATQADLDFTAGFARTFTLGAATGGTSPLNYGLSHIVSGVATGTIPDELVFTATSTGLELRSTDGLATTAAGSYELTVTDDNGIKAMAGFTIAVADQLAFPDGAQPADLTLLTGTTIAEAITFGSATGGKATVNHVLTRDGSTIAGGTAAFPGVTYTAATGSLPALLSGTPTEDNVQHMLTYTATDANGASVAFVVNAFIAASPVFAPLAIAATYTQNNAVYSSGGTRSASGASLTLPAAFGGVAPLSYAVLVNNLQTAGLTPTVQTDNRVFVSGTPSAIGDFTYTRQVTDANADTEHGTFNLTVNVAAAPVFTTTQSDVDFAQAIPKTVALTAVSGGAGDVVYTLNRISPDGATVPAALSIDSATQMLIASSGILVSHSGRYEIIATDINGITATSGQFEITVSGPLTLPGSIADVTFTLGLSQSRILQAAGGGRGTLSYDIDAQSGSVYPTELFSLNFNSRELAYLGGGQTYVAGGTASFALTWKVIDETTPTAMTMSASFNIIVVDSPTFAQDDIDELIGGYSFHVGTALPAAATLPAVTDGALPLTYKLTDGANSPYGQAAFGKNGITFDAATRMFSGTPERETRHRMHYHVRDANGSMVAQNTSVRIIAAMTLTQSDLLFGNGQTGINVRLAEPVNNIAETERVTYSLTDLDGGSPASLPSGITYDSVNNEIGGAAPSGASTASFIYTATDTFDNSMAVTTFSIGIILRPTFDPSLPQRLTYTIGGSGAQGGGSSYDEFTLPEATGGTAPISHQVLASNLPSGLTAEEDTDGNVVFSGTPTRTGEYVYTRSATDSADEPESSTFTLTIVVVAAPRFTDSIPAMVFTPGQAGVNFTLPVASGGVVGDGGYTYSVSGLPKGLALDETVPSIGGIPTASFARTNLTFIATDANGATASVLFALTVTGELTLAIENEYTFTVGGNVQLPAASGGQGPYTYDLVNKVEVMNADGDITTPKLALTNALAFNTTTRRISGELTIAAASDLTVADLTYSATDTKGVTVIEVFTLRIVPVVFSGGDTTLRFRLNQPAEYPLTYRFSADEAGGVEVSGYAVDLLGDDEGDLGDGDGADGLTYNITEPLNPKVTSDGAFGPDSELAESKFTLTATYSITGTNDVVHSPTLTFTLRTADSAEFMPVNEKMLSKVAAASVAGTLGAITDRIATATSAVPIVSIGGQSPMMALAQTIKAWADDAVDTTALIANSKFVLPFNRGGYGADSTASGAVWGSAHFRQLSGDDEDADSEGGLPTVKWDGNISGVHLGFDFKVSDDTLLGLAVSRSRASMDYKATPGSGNNLTFSQEGEYEVNLDALHPYINWAVGDVNLYASAGVGEGELTVTPQDEPSYKSDLELTAYGLGVSGDLNESVQVRGEWRRGEIEVEGNVDDENTIAPQNLNTSTTRILARWHDANRRDDNRAIFAEVGWRLDGGDGDSGAGMETALGWNYLGDRTTVEIGAHGLIGRDDYSEWGAYGNFRVSSGNDGQGFAVRIRPSYGESQTEFGRVWNADSLDDIDAGDDNDAADKNYAWRTESRLSYGIQSANGLFAPFIDAVAGDAADDIYRLGVDWSPHPYFDLNLTGERRHNQDDDENRILLQGEVKF